MCRIDRQIFIMSISELYDSFSLYSAYIMPMLGVKFRAIPTDGKHTEREGRDISRNHNTITIYHCTLLWFLDFQTLPFCGRVYY